MVELIELPRRLMVLPLPFPLPAFGESPFVVIKRFGLNAMASSFKLRNLGLSGLIINMRFFLVTLEFNLVWLQVPIEERKTGKALQSNMKKHIRKKNLSLYTP